MSHRTSLHQLPSFDLDDIANELWAWPLSLEYLSNNKAFQSILTGIRNCGLSILLDGNIYPESKCMKDLTTFEILMNQLIAVGEVPPRVIRCYSRLMEVLIRATLCEENPKVHQLQYKHRLSLLPYLD